MIFDANNYIGKYAMLCYLASIGRRWRLGKSYFKENYFSSYKEYTAYSFNEGQYCNVEYFKNNGYKVLKFDDFDWGDDCIDDVSDDELLDFIGGSYEI